MEVLEHLVDPLEEMKKLANSSEQIYISTLFIKPNFRNPTWWYLQPETGQHIFSLKEKLKHYGYENEDARLHKWQQFACIESWLNYFAAKMDSGTSKNCLGD